MTALFSQDQEVLVRAERISCMYVYCPEFMQTLVFVSAEGRMQ